MELKMERNSECLEHHGILGQKWGVRRYQNEDGTLTEAGKERQEKNAKRVVRDINKGHLGVGGRGYSTSDTFKAAKSTSYVYKTIRRDKEFKKANWEYADHPKSKKAKQNYIEQSIRVVDKILGDHKDDPIREVGYNNKASDYLLAHFFDIKVADLDSYRQDH